VAQLSTLGGMTRTMIFRTPIFAVVLLCAGCVPMSWQDTPHITGSVVGSETKQPIIGAELKYPDYPKLAAFTGPDGRFDFPASSHWGVLVLLPIDRHPPFHALTVSAAGYITTNLQVNGWRDYTNAEFYLGQP
jgi:hypothetical protein